MSISPYVARLREKIGNELLLLPSVAVLPWDSDGHLLLVKASDSGQWQTIGGSVELDESPPVAAQREALEEAGVTVELGDVIGVLGGPEFHMTYGNGDQVAYVSIVFEASVVAGDAQPDNDETTDVAWVGLDDLDELELTPFTQEMFAALGLTA